MTATRVTIEQAGTIGTANHVFQVSRPVAVAEKITDDLGYTERWDLRSLTSREVVGELFPAVNDGRYFAWNTDEIHGTRQSAASGSRTFMEAVSAILGTPGTGYTHYRKAS